MEFSNNPQPHPSLEGLVLTPADSYPWDDWQKRAITQGIDEATAALGRSLMREAYNHSWSYRLMHECGWSDGGSEMIARLQQDPEQTVKRWKYLLVVDGGHLTDEQAAQIVGRDAFNAIRTP